MFSPTFHKRISPWFMLTLGMIPLVFWAFKYLNSDMWFDEVFSLQHYVLVPWSETVFNYPYPNNHILFNLIDQSITRILGLRNIYDLADQVYILRAVQLAFSFFCGFYCYRIVSQLFSSSSAVLVIPILRT